MAEISFGGLATGLPTEDLVSSLMAIERRPLDRLEADKEYETIRLQAYEQFDAKLEDLRSAAGNLNITSDVQTTSVRLSSEEFITATSNGAREGSYDIAVAQLAQVQKTVSSGYSSETENIFGTGTFAIGAVSLEIDDSNNSLQGLMQAINNVSEDTGVSASIINDGNDSGNYHMVLTGNDASITFSLDYDLKDSEGDAIDLSESNVRTAQQAIAYVDGIEVMSNTNTLTGVIAGVTINLNKESEIITPAADGNPAVYETSTLNVEADTASLKEKISTFVTSYNSVMDWISSGYDVILQTADEASTATEDEERPLSDYLRGDATINDIKRSLQSILSESIGSSGSLQILSEIGISTQSDGTLHINNGKLDEKLDANFDDVVKLLAGEGNNDGVMKKFNSYLVQTTSAVNGMYADKHDRYEDAIRRLDLQISRKEPLMDKIEERIRAQFNAMELLVSNLNAQSDYLTQQMDILSNMYNRN
ncbi:flagellar capping protein [Desulfocapsa sulfexigens DSM 10523]|uniref:Flagellar hook-associated protein 2 n=1 Tax=Desulfocapsa sulfexigens (strain DSM 10523 / SB164P1) TaxID=1167006 RepID=M1PDH1_DESSD|nr:flagellar filament capping protein FliD [Desulfocapsa sulfexigens]AGF79642.1 flagellar capping protein [Desulfocapsa sulfexigens DSM 10523]